MDFGAFFSWKVLCLFRSFHLSDWMGARICCLSIHAGFNFGLDPGTFPLT